MAEVAEVEGRLEKALGEQRQRLEMLGILSALVLVGTATWYAWPAIDGRVELLPRLGPGIVLMVLALAMQDFVDFGPKHRSRLGAGAALSWPPLLVMGAGIADTSQDYSVLAGHALFLVVSVACFEFGNKTLTGSLQAVRYRGIVQLLGVATGASLLLSSPTDGSQFMLGWAVCGAALVKSLFDLFGSDEQRPARLKFAARRDALEGKILQLRSEGVKLDQAASLLLTATEVGYKDPKEGMALLSASEDDLERTLALSSDIQAIRADAAEAVEQADDVAPTAKRPARCLAQGDRESQLGSLREAEMLYRKAKGHARDIIDFWAKAEASIGDAKRSLAGCEGAQFESLFRAVKDAEEALEREEPAEAAGLAASVPEHVGNLSQTGEGAEETLDEAKRAVEAAKGIDDADFAVRLTQADEALASGDFSLARGMADSVLREVTRESESMVEVQKGWRQRKKLLARWAGRADEAEWDEKLEAINKARKRKQWSHAAMLLEQLTAELDSTSAASGEAGELLDFLQGEWRGLRNKLEAMGIKVDDAERNACEAAIGEANAAHGTGDVETTLEKLGQADSLMEKLRRRI